MARTASRKSGNGASAATVGQLVDDAMASLECDNPALKGILPKDYARPALDKLEPYRGLVNGPCRGSSGRNEAGPTNRQYLQAPMTQLSSNITVTLH